LSSGVIASTQNSDPSNNVVYQSRNANALMVPMVVLIDGDTASAAEVLAGALRENNRARLVGKNTFGKGCTQTLFRLPPGPRGAPFGARARSLSRPGLGRGRLASSLQSRRRAPGTNAD